MLCTDELTLFVHGRQTGLGFLHIHLSADQTNTTDQTRTKRASDSEYLIGAAVYSPRVWNETLKTWVPSSEIEVCVVAAHIASQFLLSLSHTFCKCPATAKFL